MDMMGIIKPIAHIHDAQYFLVRKDPTTLKWLNDNLIECMEWQNLSEIKHDQVKITAGLEIYFPTWNDKIQVPNNASLSEITKIIASLNSTV
ncbi:MAG: hypothetical protein MI922_02155 [Bacteroidales bacterium]|nr:hypothetical protein [Bacteroidales bacterium]